MFPKEARLLPKEVRVLPKEARVEPGGGGCCILHLLGAEGIQGQASKWFKYFLADSVWIGHTTLVFFSLNILSDIIHLLDLIPSFILLLVLSFICSFRLLFVPSVNQSSTRSLQVSYN